MEMIDVRRHGDVLILAKKGFSIPKSVQLKADKLIHKGTNNSHVISKGSALFGDNQGVKVMRIEEPSTVSHVGGSATHESKPIPPGDYWVEIQQFYDHLSEEAKKVID